MHEQASVDPGGVSLGEIRKCSAREAGIVEWEIS